MFGFDLTSTLKMLTIVLFTLWLFWLFSFLSYDDIFDTLLHSMVSVCDYIDSEDEMTSLSYISVSVLSKEVFFLYSFKGATLIDLDEIILVFIFIDSLGTAFESYPSLCKLLCFWRLDLIMLELLLVNLKRTYGCIL